LWIFNTSDNITSFIIDNKDIVNNINLDKNLYYLLKISYTTNTLFSLKCSHNESTNVNILSMLFLPINMKESDENIEIDLQKMVDNQNRINIRRNEKNNITKKIKKELDKINDEIIFRERNLLNFKKKIFDNKILESNLQNNESNLLVLQEIPINKLKEEENLNHLNILLENVEKNNKLSIIGWKEIDNNILTDNIYPLKNIDINIDTLNWGTCYNDDIQKSEEMKNKYVNNYITTNKNKLEMRFKIDKIHPKDYIY
jgi:hypothetical protein